jgi:hypothetical protein
MNKAICYRVILGALFLTAVVVLGNGCISDETAENRSAQPWNTPKTWENGLPEQINQGR